MQLQATGAKARFFFDILAGENKELAKLESIIEAKAIVLLITTELVLESWQLIKMAAKSEKKIFALHFNSVSGLVLERLRKLGIEIENEPITATSAYFAAVADMVLQHEKQTNTNILLCELLLF